MSSKQAETEQVRRRQLIRAGLVDKLAPPNTSQTAGKIFPLKEVVLLRGSYLHFK